MQTKFGKEKKLFTDEKFRVKYGTIDALKLNAIYLNVESWVIIYIILIPVKDMINF